MCKLIARDLDVTRLQFPFSSRANFLAFSFFPSAGHDISKISIQKKKSCFIKKRRRRIKGLFRCFVSLFRCFFSVFRCFFSVFRGLVMPELIRRTEKPRYNYHVSFQARYTTDTAGYIFLFPLTHTLASAGLFAYHGSGPILPTT